MSSVDAIRRRGPRPAGSCEPTSSDDFETALDRILQSHAAAEPESAPVALPEGSVRFSRHARTRLEAMEQTLSAEDYAQLEHGVDELSARGSREALVLIGELALVVGVPRRVVITAQSVATAMGTVFTDIDSTLLLESR